MRRRAPLPAAAGLLAALAGCSPRVTDVRPIAAHAGQQLDREQVLVSWDHGVRTTLRYMRPEELDVVFRLPGPERATGNPFLHRPPAAPAKFIVFRLDVRNEGEYDVFVEPERIRMRDEQGDTFVPEARDALLDYWIGRVSVELGKPLTWSAQMDALRRREEKEKSVVETVFSGGRVAPRGEHVGYVVFRDTMGTLERANPLEPDDVMSFVSPFRLAGVVWRWITRPATKDRRLQVFVEIVTRASRYGNPLRLSLLEGNFDKVTVPARPLGDEEYDAWRPQ